MANVPVVVYTGLELDRASKRDLTLGPRCSSPGEVARQGEVCVASRRRPPTIS
jgi:hypothetical protein